MGRRVKRADRRRAERSAPRRETRARPEPAPSSSATAFFGENAALLARAGFVVVAGVFLFALARAVEARITWYLAVDQFGYLQFANDLLHGKVFHDWEPARIMGILPKRTDILAQTYVWENGRMYCRYSPGFPMLVAGWLALFGEARIAFLNPTIFLSLFAVVMACEWRLTGSVWRGLIVAVLIALCPTMMYWWSLTLTRDLSAHLFAFTGLYQLLPRAGRPLTLRRAVVAFLAVGFAGSIRNDAILYLLPATLLMGAEWLRNRRQGRGTAKLLGAAAAGLVLGLLPTLSYNAITRGNPFRPTQGMEIEKFLPTAPQPTVGGPRVGFPPLWKGGKTAQVQGGGLRLEHFSHTAPLEWLFVFSAYGWVLLGFAVLGAIVALLRRPTIFLMTVPYAVTAFLFYSCWSRPDRRYIIGLYIMVPFLIAEGVLGSADLVRLIARRRGEDVARIVAIVIGVVAAAVAFVPIPMPPPTPDAAFLSKGVLPVLTMVLPLAAALAALAAAMAPSQRVPRILAPAIAIVLVGYGVTRANETRSRRAPFQQPQAALARQTMRRTLEPRSVVITSEDMGRPAENIEYYGGFPSFYLTDLDRWNIKLSRAALAFVGVGMRPYLLIDRLVDERARVLADLADHGFVAERVLEIPADQKMQYFVAAPSPRLDPKTKRELGCELFRISKPDLEKLIRELPPKT